MVWVLIINTLDILRGITYGWVLFECIFLMYLYGMAARQMKKTPIIKSIHFLFFTLTVYFGLRTSLPFYKITAPSTYNILLQLTVIPAIMVAFALRIFRLWSLEMPVSAKFNKFVGRVLRAKKYLKKKQRNNKQQAKK